MIRILGIELRRSAAFGAALFLVIAGSAIMHATPGRWSAGWMALVMLQREYLLLLSPLAMAAGAWQSYRAHRSGSAELLASAARPRLHQVLPTLGALGLAVAAGYLLIAVIAAVRIADTAEYLPAAVFVVLAVGAVTLAVSAWVGLAIGRLVPALATAPVLAVTGFALLAFGPEALPDEWLRVAFSPGYGMSQFNDYQTVDGRVSAVQALWVVAIGLAGATAFAARRERAWTALVPLAVGAALVLTTVPHGAEYDRGTADPVAQALVCTRNAPRVCVSRVHSGLLAEVAGPARRALTALATLPGNTVVRAHEDTSTFSPATAPEPRADTALMQVTVDRNGHLAHPGRLEPTLLLSVFLPPRRCESGPDLPVLRAATHWLLGTAPVPDPSVQEPAEENAEAVRLWQALRQLPPTAAATRVAAVRDASRTCADLTGLLTR